MSKDWWFLVFGWRSGIFYGVMAFSMVFWSFFGVVLGRESECPGEIASRSDDIRKDQIRSDRIRRAGPHWSRLEASAEQRLLAMSGIWLQSNCRV